LKNSKNEDQILLFCFPGCSNYGRIFPLRRTMGIRLLMETEKKISNKIYMDRRSNKRILNKNYL
jgi:hypothetical protein